MTVKYYLQSMLMKTPQRHCMCYAVLQIVTVLANMAQSSSCFNEIVDNDGLALLINFLNITPNSKLTEAELAACERVHQKSAIALTRLAKDPDNAARIVHKGGMLPVLVCGYLL